MNGRIPPSSSVRPLIGASWGRSRKFGVDPASERASLVADRNAIETLAQGHRQMIEAASQVIAPLRDYLVESGAVMVLTDATGTVMTIDGAPAILDRAQFHHLVPGANWDESVIGTNGIGTALATGAPIQIRAAEHFCEGIRDWGCSGAVIRDPVDGRIQGVLDITGLAKNQNDHCLAHVMAGAGHIEARLSLLEAERRARLFGQLAEHGVPIAKEGLILFDRMGRILRCGAKAKDLLASLGIDSEDRQRWKIAGFSADGARPLPVEIDASLIEPVMEGADQLGFFLILPSRSPPIRRGAPEPEPAGAFAAIIGKAPALVAARKKVERLAPLRVPVLLQGPTGTGKEVFANALHKGGTNPSGPFVAVNCGAISRELLASELFGYADGAFTGARKGGHPGKFETANGGTLFLDEIGEMPLDLQPMLLRVLEEETICRIGEQNPRPLTVRLVTATNRDLRTQVEAGKFRADLYYRLSVTMIQLPALCERKEDLPMLVHHFIERAARLHGVLPKRPTAGLLAAMSSYGWPGNLRELRNVVESMILFAEGDSLVAADLHAAVVTDFASASAEDLLSVGRLADHERQLIVLAIRTEAGNLTQAALRLGIAKSTLYEKMKRHNIAKPSEASQPQSLAGDGTGSIRTA